ncbi:hypothetical protein SDC9_126204 [bioreactor metagenome]|uniref:Uncharacterized protein n=1 Tax=bioreactor metagenome TaxID=1076179 RepID=A0A645CQH1_9ZZZZ
MLRTLRLRVIPNGVCFSVGNLTVCGFALVNCCYTRIFFIFKIEKITDKTFLKSLKKYKKYGVFEDRLIQKNDINEKPIIINVNKLDILNKKGIPIPHYIVLLKEKNKLWVYDGKDFKRKVKRDFNSLLDASDDINRFHQDGMWLIFQ